MVSKFSVIQVFFSCIISFPNPLAPITKYSQNENSHSKRNKPVFSVDISATDFVSASLYCLTQEDTELVSITR